MTQTEEIANIIVQAIQAALKPIEARIKELEHQVAALKAKGWR